eukprot:TRINITY_DN12450_c0_g6_i2.p1 TRINITY_DN12450_c0_g6~~TRINITY_DN12450_c0_g6_i2.p1  ORF type:complete len:623 (+),score=114.50 TRINITY_DN12450_c0_g6_i2:52-1869(+)
MLTVLKGVNVTIFAYGQTASGKTFTIRGNETSPGIIPLSVTSLFAEIKNNQDRKFSLSLSSIELYNETVNDLLTSSNQNLELRENLQGTYVKNLTTRDICNVEETISYFNEGDSIKKTGETLLNAQSSRSHTIFRITINSESEDLNANSKTSQLNIVDLAGSEGISRTKAEGIRLKYSSFNLLREGVNINKSLLALSNVIHQLSQSTRKYINYRDSKLTRILQPALGGNSKTLIVCTISQSRENYQETLSTLQFGVKAKKIKNIVKVNEGTVSDASKLALALEEIERLKAELSKLHKENTNDSINSLQTELSSKAERIRNLRQQLYQHSDYAEVVADCSSTHKNDKSEEIERVKEEINELNRQKKELERGEFSELIEDSIIQKEKIQELERTVSEQRIQIQNASTELTILKAKLSVQDLQSTISEAIVDDSAKEAAKNAELLRDIDRLYTELELDKEAISNLKELNEKCVLDLTAEAIRKEELARETERLIESVYNNYLQLYETAQKSEVLEKERDLLKIDIAYYRREAIRAKKLKEGKLTTNELIAELQQLRDEANVLRNENLLFENGLFSSIKKRRKNQAEELSIELKRKKVESDSDNILLFD